MPYTPEELLLKQSQKDKEALDKAIIEIDEALLTRFTGTAIYIDCPQNVTAKILQALQRIYGEKGWVVSTNTSPKNESYLEFQPNARQRR